MDKLLKLEKYQLLHNSIYWCGMIGIFILGFFTADTYVTEVMGPTEEIVSSLADIFNGMVYDSTFLLIIMCGTEIRVLDEELAEALKQLPEQSRNIVLMFFFLDMSDSEIGEKLNINRSTSYRHRRNSLEEIRKQLKEKKTNEE